MMLGLKYKRLHTSLKIESLDPCRDPNIKKDRAAKTTERENAG
jgi:hypothetical protein